MSDLDQTPIVLTGPKNTSPLLLGSGCVTIVSGITVWFVTHVALIAGIVVGVGVWAFVLGIVTRKMGFSLTLTPEGLGYVHLGGKRFWRWRDVDSFDLIHFKAAWVIGMRDYTKDPRGKQFYLPSRWDRDMHSVVNLLKQAQEKWGTP